MQGMKAVSIRSFRMSGYTSWSERRKIELYYYISLSQKYNLRLNNSKISQIGRLKYSNTMTSLW